MLAQNFKTAEDLEVSEKHYVAMVQVLNALERGELVHVRDVDYDCETPNAFNMTEWQCGTAGCIGGWVRKYSGDGGDKFDTTTDALWDLCYPSMAGKYEDITTEQAAYALRSYLTTGDSRWPEALLIKD